MKQTSLLASPLIATLLAEVCMEFVDTLMMGRLGTLSLAAGGLGSAIFMAFFICCLGLTIATGTCIARSYGENNADKILHFTQQGLWLNLCVTMPCILILWYFPYYLHLLGQQSRVIPLTQGYLHGLLWALPPAIGFTCLREFVAALKRPQIVMYIAIPAILLNVILNYILMYGRFGIPALGITGIGIATSLVQYVMLGCLVLYININRYFKQYGILAHFHRPHWPTLKTLLRLGWPISVMLLFEVGLFTVTAFLMGIISTQALAAYQIAVQCIAIVFMIPLGISQATTLRVSHSLGQDNPQNVKRLTASSLTLGLLFAIINGIIFWCFTKTIVGFYLDIQDESNRQVVVLASHFLKISTLFILMDAAQIIINGALRGLKDTFVPMCIGLIAYWGIGISAGITLGFLFNQGENGLWLGLIIGISSCGLLLFSRFCFKIYQICP